MVNKSGKFEILETYYDFGYLISGKMRDFRLMGDNRGNFYMLPFDAGCSAIDILLAGVCKGQLEANLICKKLSNAGLGKDNFGREVQERILRENPELLQAWTQEYNSQTGRNESLRNIPAKVVSTDGINNADREDMTKYLIEHQRMLPAVVKQPQNQNTATQSQLNRQ